MRHVRVKCHRLDPEDVFQKVCERALAKQNSFDTARPVYPWVAGFVVNIVREECRKASRQPRHRDDLDLIAPAAESIVTPEERAAEAARVVGSFMQLLSPGDRELIEWQSFEKLSHEQMAKCKGISNAAMRQRVNRAMNRLKAVAKDYLEGGQK
jgi:RNA polymerase sigma factor (sigma-70 family)